MAQVLDLYVPWTHQNQKIKYEFSFPELPAVDSQHNVTLGGDLFLDRLAQTFKYSWDHRYNLTKVEVYSAPVTQFSTAPANPPSRLSQHVEDIVYRYGPLGDLESQQIVPAPQSAAIADTEYYINENGHELIRLNAQGKLESHQLWADSVDRLLAVEDNVSNNSGGADRILAWTYTDYQGTIRAAKSTSSSAASSISKINYDDFGRALFSTNQDSHDLQSVVRARQFGYSFYADSALYFDGSRFYDPTSGRLLRESEFAPDSSNPYLVAGNNPLQGPSQAIASRIGESNLNFFDGFVDEYFRQANPVEQWNSGNRAGAIVQGLAYAAAIIPSAILAPVALGIGAATFTGEYLAMQGAISSIETQIEWQIASQLGSEFNPAAAFAKNFGVNVATGGIGAGAKWSSRAGSFLLRQGIEIAGDTAIDVGVYGNDFGQSVFSNALGSFGGEALGAAAKGGWRAFNDNFEIMLERSAVYTNVGGLASGLKIAKREVNYVKFNKTHIGSVPQPKGVGPNGGRLQSHHGLQQQWAKENLAKYGYNPDLAPTITIETGIGHPHSVISAVQNARRIARVDAGQGKWSSSLQDELQYIIDDLSLAGFSKGTINRVLKQQYRMLDKIGVPYSRIDF